MPNSRTAWSSVSGISRQVRPPSVVFAMKRFDAAGSGLYDYTMQ